MNQRKVLAENRKARYEYFIEDEYEAGIVLLGTEVKTISDLPDNRFLFVIAYFKILGDDDIPAHLARFIFGCVDYCLSGL